MPQRFLLAVALLLFVMIAGEPAFAAKRQKKITLKFPRFTLAQSSNVGACVFVRLPIDNPADVAGFTLRHRGIGRGTVLVHFLVYLYQGDNLDAFAQQANQVVFDRGCLDLGPTDRHRRQLVASGGGGNTSVRFSPGLSLPVIPSAGVPGGAPIGVGILMDANWLNSSAKDRRVSSRVTLQLARPGTVRRRLESIRNDSTTSSISVPPFTVGLAEQATEARWRPPTDVCLYDMTTHMHRRGVFASVDLFGPDGTPKNPEPTFPDSFEPERSHLFSAPDYTDPGTRRFPEGFLMRRDESLGVACRHDNGVSRSVRLGCEEEAGVAPGGVGAAAKVCNAPGLGSAECPPVDAAYASRSFTGACVPANLVGGDGGNDEACAATGLYYEPNADGSCSVQNLPALP